jgi:hypothetical protein
MSVILGLNPNSETKYNENYLQKSFYPKQKARVFLLGGKRLRVEAGTDLDLSQVPFELTAEERRLGMSGLVQKYMGDALKAIGDPSLPDWPTDSVKAFDNVTMAQFLRQRGASRGAIQLVELPIATAETDLPTNPRHDLLRLLSF